MKSRLTLPTYRLEVSFLPPASTGKYIGDEFAALEANATLAMAVLRFYFELEKSKAPSINIINPVENLDHPVGMKTVAKIHTRRGLHMIANKKQVN